jgi:hypothetical protein
MVMVCVFFGVRIEYLNIIMMSFGFKGLIKIRLKKLFLNAIFLQHSKMKQSIKIISTNPMKCLKLICNVTSVYKTLHRFCNKIYGNKCK